MANNGAHSAHIPALTGLRAIAATMVFIHHFTMRLQSDHLWVQMGKECYTGVSVFFVLSGFLIQYRYQTLFSKNVNSYLYYFGGRVARVWPLYFLLVCFTFMVQYLWYGSKMGSFAQVLYHWMLSITFLKGFGTGDLIFSGIAQGWSLTVEYSFYLAAPFLILYSQKVGQKILVAGLLALVGAIIYGIYANLMALPLKEVLQHTAIYTIFGRLFEFLAGLQLAQWHSKLTEKERLKSNFPYRTTLATIAFILCLGLLSVLKGKAAVAIDTLPGLFLHNTLLPIIIAAMMYGLIVERSFMKRLLESHEMEWMGKASYAFYLIHIGVFQYFLEIRLSLDPLQCFVVLWVMAWLLYRYIEQPLQSYISGIFNNKKQRQQ